MPPSPQQLIAEAQRLFTQRRFADAELLLRQLLSESPDNPELLHHIGLICHLQRKFAEAEKLIRQAISRSPSSANYHVTLGEALREQGRLPQAIDSFHRAIELQPDRAIAHYNMGVAYRQMRCLGKAIDAYRVAVQFDPSSARAFNNLGTALRAQGRIDEAIAALRRSLSLSPTPASHSNLLYAMWFDPGATPESILAEHARFTERWCQPLSREHQTHANDRAPDRRLRIGYVSPDFRRHVISLFMWPILHHRDRRAFEIFCYADVPTPDFMTDRIRGESDVWVPTHGMTDAALADRIRADRIDILVDLTAHMANNRMLVFARKPAPVQVSYLAYAGTTGLPAIDYRLSDVHLDPENAAAFGPETVIRLPETYWCYQPAIELPPVSPTPAAADSSKGITFACFNSTAKVNATVIALWSEILRQLPNSRIQLIADGGRVCNEHLPQSFARHGIEAHRIEVLDTLPYDKYFSLYARVDIALDPFPYNGGTTTIDALYMGIPVVTFAGACGMSRAGVGIMTNASLTEFIAATPEQYLEIAVELARDVPRLVALRAQLRDQITRSPLMNAPRFVRNLEAAYRSMWQNYCQ